MTRVFVYGTLLRGERNHHILRGSPCLGEARTEPAYMLVSLGSIPAMTRGGTTSVKGEVFEIPDDVLDALDRLEGHPDWYERTTIRLADGSSAEAYLMEPSKVEGCLVIASGDWREELGS
ncbi:MAG: gamma-glutamylcyclotransferase [Desulfomonile sp.]|nr:gamma-glutamylcyclotransferase [Desulfomonile sp.]